MYPAEAEQIGRAVPKRQAEFATVRRCARQALSALGADPGPILPGPTRKPIWPAGIVGSMTHCDGYRAAAVAWDRVLFSAKESVYKAWFPLTASWLNLTDAYLDLDEGGTFTARIPRSIDEGWPALRTVKGRWATRDGFVFTAVHLRSDPLPDSGELTMTISRKHRR